MRRIDILRGRRDRQRGGGVQLSLMVLSGSFFLYLDPLDLIGMYTKHDVLVSTNCNCLAQY